MESHVVTSNESLTKLSSKQFVAQPARSIEWLGGITYQNLHYVLERMKFFIFSDPINEIQLFINSYGGTTGIGMSFYDSVRSVYKPHLTTVGSGDVDSSALIVFLAGERRFITKNTTLLLHLAGRTFEADKRFSTKDMEDMLKEDKLKDYQYACVVSDATHGAYSPQDVLTLMAKHTILTADEAVNMGLAHAVVS